MSEPEIHQDPNGPSDYILLQSDDDDTTAKVYLFGAHVVSFKVGGYEKLWMSSLSTMDGSGPIRGGIPIAFPQFADEGPLTLLHGFARESLWNVVEGGTDFVKLELKNDEKTFRLWPFAFCLSYLVRLLPSSSTRRAGISLELKVINTDETNPMTFSGCLHTYFKFDNALDVSLFGFIDTKFVDKADDRKEKIQNGPIQVEIEAYRSAKDAQLKKNGFGFVDRIHYNSPSKFSFVQTSNGRVLYDIEQSESWTDTTVYNPYLGDKQGPSYPDFDDDGYKYTICCEPTLSGKSAVTLLPGQEWIGNQIIHVPQ